jgi:hypothetical protein
MTRVRGTTRTNRAQACQTWRQARRMADRAVTDHDHIVATRDEQAAWDYYADICDQLGECVTPGCHTPSPDHVHCERHRE